MRRMRKTCIPFIVGAAALIGVANGFSSHPALARSSQTLSLPTRYPSATGASSKLSVLFMTASSSKKNLSSSANADMVQGGESAEKVPFHVVLWKFSRPHTIIGSAMAIPSLHMLAATSLSSAFSAQNLLAMAFAMIPACLMNLYITGLNQITDVEIDKVNKPYLPIAAGMLNMRDATVTVVVSLLLSLTMGLSHPILSTPGLNVALWGSAILGTLYSLPPARLKRFPFLAAFCIVAVRGAIINASFFAHAKAAAFGSTGATVLGCLATDRACFLSSLFFGVFGLVIALMKDVPDVLGDRMANVKTFSVRIGQKQVFHGMRRLLSGLFFGVGAMFLRGSLRAPSMAITGCRLVTSIASGLAGWSVSKEAQTVDPEDSSQVYEYYMHLWKLFYLSYLVLPFAR
jgi:homogentisate phytyltransferase/homogentisate geranylgeranyltransferase